MQSVGNINLSSLLGIFISLLTAFLLGGLIGFERQVRQRTAGLRTNTLVAVGSAAFVTMVNPILFVYMTELPDGLDGDQCCVGLHP